MSQAQKLCKYGPKCDQKTCKFFHPKEVEAKHISLSIKKKESPFNKEKNVLASLRTQHSLSDKHRVLLKSSLATTKRLLVEKKALQLQSDEFDKKYVSVDIKGVSGSSNPFTDKLKNVDLQIQEVKSLLRSEFKGMNVPMRLIVCGSVNNTAASVNKSVLVIDPAYSTEFASCAALFEQVRDRHIRIRYDSISRRDVPESGVNTSTFGIGLGFIAIDTDSATAATSPTDLIDASNHAVYRLAVVGSTSLVSHMMGGCEMHYTPPPLLFGNATTGVGLVGGSWTSTLGSAGSVCVAGYLKFWEDNQYTATTAQVGQIIEEHFCEFRMRD